MSHWSLLSIVRCAGLAFLAFLPCGLTVAAGGRPPNQDKNPPPASGEIKPLTDLDNTPRGGILPGGTLPGGTLP
ncbi:MAG: hypothetical protein KGJ82_20670, partial [Nitrospirota bacterium]|nr:hypothetical protein [Nitrospirota bacterium]